LNTREVLVKARAKVERGWCQHACAIDRRGYKINAGPLLRGPSRAKSVCAVAAIAIASPDWWIDQGAAQPLVRAVGVASAQDLLGWNNAPERTHAEVLAAFDKAIAEAGE
jgi:hypothetical protein